MDDQMSEAVTKLNQQLTFLDEKLNTQSSVLRLQESTNNRINLNDRLNCINFTEILEHRKSNSNSFNQKQRYLLSNAENSMARESASVNDLKFFHWELDDYTEATVAEIIQ